MKPIMQLFLLAAFLAVLASCSEVFSENRGSRAPDFELPDLHGTIHQLSDYEDGKVYIHFWASWCSICLAGMSELEELAESDNGFTVLTIVSPGTHAEKDAQSFKSWFSSLDRGHEMIVLMDEGGIVYEGFKMDGYPSSAWIGSDGKIAEKRTGHVANYEIVEVMNSIH